MTYRELQSHIEELEEEQLDFHVMCYIDDEYYKVLEFQIKEKNGRLEDGHPFVIVD
jgi:hypothetical protein